MSYPILIKAYNSNHSFRAELEFYVRLQPDGWFFVVHEGTPVGVGGMVNYGTFAYIGLIAVSPTVHLLGWLEERNCLSARLVATQAGEGLYRKLGFVEESICFVEREPLQQKEALYALATAAIG